MVDQAPERHPQIQTLMASDLVDSTRLVETLGDTAAADLFAEHDRLARRLVDRHRGREIDKSDGFLLLFERPIEAMRCALAYHQALADLSSEHGIALTARVGIHLGEVILRENSKDEVSRGAKPIDVEGLAKPIVFRIAALAVGGQTLLTRAAFAMARHSSEPEAGAPSIAWIAHGRYLVKGVEEPIAVFEGGIPGRSPMIAPADHEKAQRVTEDGAILGWRPGRGQEIPRRENWRLHEKLGEGGFGEAWLAEHTKTREQRVFKFCFDERALRTFQHETTLFRVLKETLGQRDDIARILDWNFDSAPYFIESDYTEGGNLVDWAAANGGLGAVPLDERLELIAQVADALGAAHSVGVLHKDIKPRNVLVETRDSRPRAKLTDFGIGRLIDEEILAEAGITKFDPPQDLTKMSGSSGTPLYMAPERLEGRQATVQGDIYALGIMLYQMVVGDFGRTLAHGWERDVDDELLRRDIAESVDGSPERRIGDARRLAERLRTLASRRAELESERAQLEAAEEARASLALSRQRRRALSGALVALALFTAVVAYQARQAKTAARIAQQEALRATEEAERANRERVTADRVSGFLLDLFHTADPDEARGDTLTAREILDHAAEKIEAGLAEEPLVLARLGRAIGEVYFKLGLYPEAEPLAERALELRREHVGPQSLEVAEAADTLANIYWYQDKMAEAEELYKLSLQIREERLPADDPLTAKSLNNLGLHYVVLGHFEEAEPLYARSLEIREAAYGEKHPRVGLALHNLAHLYDNLGRDEEALELYQRSVAVVEASSGPDAPATISTQAAIAEALRRLGRYEESQTLVAQTLARAKHVFGDEHFVTYSAMLVQARLWHDGDRFDEAEAMYEAIIAGQESEHGPSHPYIVSSLVGYAELLIDRDRSPQARALLDRALAIRQEVHGAEHTLTQRVERILEEAFDDA